jgi:hypothetical protein
MIMSEKFGQHQPLNRQAERYALEGVPIALSTIADAVGSVGMALDPLLRMVEAHVMAAARLHADDTAVPVLAKGKTDTGRCWVYVRDDCPFGGADPPAAMFYYSRDRKGEHPGHIWPGTPASCRLMPMDTISCIWLGAILDRSGKRRADPDVAFGGYGADSQQLRQLLPQLGQPANHVDRGEARKARLFSFFNKRWSPKGHDGITDILVDNSATFPNRR